MSKVTCICYGQEQTFRSRKAAIDFYAEAMFATEGAESERYKTILGKLYRGEDVCSDEDDFTDAILKLSLRLSADFGRAKVESAMKEKRERFRKMEERR